MLDVDAVHASRLGLLTKAADEADALEKLVRVVTTITFYLNN